MLVLARSIVMIGLLSALTVQASIQDVVTDPLGDQEPGYPSWMDIVEGSVSYNEDNSKLTFTAKVADSIPEHPSQDFCFNWLIDFDMMPGGIGGHEINDIECDIGPGVAIHYDTCHYSLWCADFCNEPPCCVDYESFSYQFSLDRRTITVEYDVGDTAFMGDFFWVLESQYSTGVLGPFADVAPNSGHGICRESHMVPFFSDYGLALLILFLLMSGLTLLLRRGRQFFHSSFRNP